MKRRIPIVIFTMVGVVGGYVLYYGLFLPNYLIVKIENRTACEFSEFKWRGISFDTIKKETTKETTEWQSVVPESFVYYSVDSGATGKRSNTVQCGYAEWRLPRLSFSLFNRLSLQLSIKYDDGATRCDELQWEFRVLNSPFFSDNPIRCLRQ
jgi:hypothetical protein